QHLLKVTEDLNKKLRNRVEFIFVVDGNPEKEYEKLLQTLPQHKIKAQLILHSRNFGSFAAIRTGLSQATGKYFATMAADLQVPPQLALDIFSSLRKEKTDIIIATRESRKDGF